MTRISGSIFMVFFVFAEAGFAAESLSLESFLEQVRTENPVIQAARSRAEASRHRVGPVSTLDDPFFAVGRDELPFGGGAGGVTRFQLSQTIPFPGKLSARGDAAESRAGAAEADAETSRRQIVVQATQLFYRAYLNQKALSLNEENRKYIRETMESTQARYTTGGASHHEWLLAKIELSTLEVENLRLQREENTFKTQLNELRDLPAETPIGRLEAHLNPQGKDQAHSDLSSQPELKSVEHELKAADSEQKSARLSYFPDFVLQGMAMKTGHEAMEPNNWGFMVGITLPLFFFNRQAELVAAAGKDYEAAAADRRALERRLQSELTEARQHLKTAKDTEILYRNSVIPATELAAKNARSEYAAKHLPLIRLLEVLRIQSTQAYEHLAAQIDVELARVRLKELLSSPSVLRLAPARPALFGPSEMAGGAMGMGESGTVSMGGGMSGPTRKQQKPQPGGSQGVGGGMGSGMGAMQ